MAGFQSVVNIQPAPGMEGDFASANPIASVLAGPGALVAGPSGLIIGRFAWVDATWTYASNAGVGLPAGFVHRTGPAQALITTYLAEFSSLIPSGFEVTLHQEGDFWVRSALTTATIGQKVFATLADGSIQVGAAGATIAGAIETKWIVGSPCLVGELFKMTSWPMG